MTRRWLLVAAAITPMTLAAQEIEVPPPGMAYRLPRSFTSRVQSDRPEFVGGWKLRMESAVQSGAAVTGVLPVAVVQALFSDSPTPAFTHTEIQAQIFSGPSIHGTVADHFTESSGGRFTVAGQALPWVRTTMTLDSVVGTGFGLGGDARTGAYLVQALAAADSTTDFSLFDNDGPDNIANSGDDDGMVDVVAFHFLEISASCGGNGIWPHRFGISGWTGAPFATDDLQPNGSPIVVDSYIIQSAVTCDGQEIARASTISHELGHVLGLPDYYDSTEGIQPEERRWVMGCWSLMAAGAWGCGQVDRTSVDRATHLGPWEKDILGWLTQVETVGPVLDSAFVIEPVLASQRVLRIPIDNDLEFLFIEQRALTGFDAGLPAAGVLVYHIEPARTRRPCSACEKIYQVALVEADGDSALVELGRDGGDRGVAGDAFQTGDRLSSGTHPSISRNDKLSSGIIIHTMVVTDSNATLTISTDLPPITALLESFLNLGETDLTAVQESFLDKYGNQNGSYDVGDLRAILRENPGSR